MNLTLKESLVTRSRVFSPWTAFYFLQSLLINLGLGYPFSLLYTAAFTAILLLLWRTLPGVQKVLVGVSSLVAACYFPFAQAYGAPNFNTLLALHSTNMEESTEILTIFPWYSYMVGIFIFVLGVIAIRRKKESEKARWNTFDSLCLVFSVATFFVAPVQNLAWGGVFKLKDTGYPVFRFAKDVIVNNNEVIEEQERMAKLSGMKDTWTVTAVKPKYQTYVVVIGESARRDALGAFGGHWDNTPFASSVNGLIFADYIAASGSTQKSLGLTLNRVVDVVPGVAAEMIGLAEHRANTAHLPHQPLDAGPALCQVIGQEFAGLGCKVEEDRTRLHQGQRFAAGSVGIDNRGYAVVGADLQELGLELMSGTDVHTMDAVRKPGLLEHDVDLVAVGRGPAVELDHRVSP